MVCLLALRRDLDEHPCRERHKSIKSAEDGNVSVKDAGYNKLESEADLRRRGVIDPRTDAYSTHEARPLADHLADWHAYLIGKGSTQQHADLSRNRVARLIDLARRGGSPTCPSRVQAALKAVRDGTRDDGVSLRSVHHYTRAVKGFSRWLWRDGRAREDALAHLTSQNPDADRRHERRALAPEELGPAHPRPPRPARWS